VKIENVKIFNRKGYEQRFKEGQVTFAANGKKLLTMKVNLNSAASVEKYGFLAPSTQRPKPILKGKPSKPIMRPFTKLT